MKNISSTGLKILDGKILVLDQTKLPHEEKWVACESPVHMAELIKSLSIRGAPLIGVAAAVALADYSKKCTNLAELNTAAKILRESRPTAVNLMAAVDRVMQSKNLIEEATKIFEEDINLCNNMAERGSVFISEGDKVLTHCNSGGLATAGIGTAFGVIRKAHEQKKNIHVFVDETRPLLQGARLTAWEFGKLNIPYTLICDNMAGMLMAQNKINKIFVGSDRIARNGDIANKIGTYSLAVLAKHHKVPFYVVAPKTTYDHECKSGIDIPIEERNADEVRAEKSPKNCKVYNPAFDVTPHSLITAIIFDDEIRYPN